MTKRGAATMADSIPPQELRAILESDPKPILLDVRRRADFEAAPEKIRGAVWRDPEKAEQWSAEISQERPVVVYCVKGGSVSQSTADRLQKTHLDVKFLQGGIKAWLDLGGPVEE
jgi:rhodanese-related sulfurtransferase